MTITIKQYLTSKSIPFKENNGELITKCLFSTCDDDSRANEAHLYFNAETGQYHCKKCNSKGNLITLKKYLNDTPSTTTQSKKPDIGISNEIVNKCHNNLPQHIRQYLNDRGLQNNIINQFKLGWAKIYGQYFITIPIKDEDNNYSFFKLRQDPQSNNTGGKYRFYPKGSSSTLFPWNILKDNKDTVVICEGEFDCLVLLQQGIPAITSTAGASTFKKEWIESLKELSDIYVCFDNDEVGERESAKLLKTLEENIQNTRLHKVTLPKQENLKDITDYFTKFEGTPDDLMYKLSSLVAGKKKIDTSKFKPITSNEIIKILGLTIKKDEENKFVTFLCELSAYTENAQFNISFNAPSSTGKSYIPTEIASLFPKEDIVEIGYCSPTAFYHDVGVLNKERGGYEIDLSRKILIFLDQPHNMLLERLRPLLSHDKKELHLKVTDKSQKGGLRTKNIFIKGYPSVIFCSAGLQIDEQEGTRFMLLSPQISQEKLRQAINTRIKKDTNNASYKKWLDANADRTLLKERIQAIRDEKIDDIVIPEPQELESYFLENKKILKPRHQRDIGRLISLIKTTALLNVWFRERKGKIIHANKDDISDAIKIWNIISESQEYNLPPFIFNLYRDVIYIAWEEKNKDSQFECMGITKQELMMKHYKVYGRMIEDFRVRQQILPMLATAGLITQEPDPRDKRKILIIPIQKV